MSGEVKRPETNEQKLGKLAEAIKDLGDGKKEAAFGLHNDIEVMENRFQETMVRLRKTTEMISNAFRILNLIYHQKKKMCGSRIMNLIAF